MEERNLTLTLEMLNDLPVNSKARAMLAEIGEEPDPSCLHSVQLVLWGIESTDLVLDEAFLETTRAMKTWSPERLANFFTDRKEIFYDPAGWEEAEDPAGLARVLVEDLEKRMATYFPWYLSAE